MEVWRARDIVVVSTHVAKEEASQALAEPSTCDEFAADKSVGTNIC